MKVHLVGDAGSQAERLKSLLNGEIEISTLPADASYSTNFDNLIEPEDVVVALRFKREQKAPRFSLLHVPGAGLDGISFDNLSPETAICNVFEHETPIAEFVMWAILNWEIRPDALRFTAETWSHRFRGRPLHGEIMGKNIGIIGFGRIGKAIAIRARAFGLRVVTLDRTLGDSEHLVDLIVKTDDLTSLLALSDYVVLALPLTDKTRSLLDANKISAMKKNGVLINIARAEIIEERALYEALRDKVIAGAYLDVWYKYPRNKEEIIEPSNLPFLDLPNVIATPHSSAWTNELLIRRYQIIADNIKRLISGHPLLNQVQNYNLNQLEKDNINKLSQSQVKL